MARGGAMRALVTLLLLGLLATVSEAAASDPDAAGLYRERCASCHEGGVARAPDVASLKQMSAAAIKSALTGGSMRTQSEGLSAAEIDAVSRFLGRAEAA